MASNSSDGLVSGISRPMDRLTIRRLSNEPREAMNCKSCRKRKIKCTRISPSCEACKVFNVDCIYDAIPKKRGPKSDVIDALLKRVNGLEQKLREDYQDDLTGGSLEATSVPQNTLTLRSEEVPSRDRDSITSVVPLKSEKGSNIRLSLNSSATTNTSPSKATHPLPQPTKQQKDTLLNHFFERHHGQPYFILDEALTRQKWEAGRLPSNIAHGVYAIAARQERSMFGSHSNGIRLSDRYSARARTSLNSDEPTIENLQTALLLSYVNFQAGKCKRSYMLLSIAITMAMALELHREFPDGMQAPSAEREGRRRLLWTCYVMDRFTATGSKRPSLIADESILLRLPAWPYDVSNVYQEGALFSTGNIVRHETGGVGSDSPSASLIGIVRVLGLANRYLGSSQNRSDSHVPWQTQSELSVIRGELQIWANEHPQMFSGVDHLLSQIESPTIILSRLVFHVIHCLLYRPFLPLDLMELTGPEHHKSWQMEATNMAFFHASTINDLLDHATRISTQEWTSFVGYCLCTAGTIHIHGALYTPREGSDNFSKSIDYLTQTMNQLDEIKAYHAGCFHAGETLQRVCAAHSHLVKSIAASGRYSPILHFDNFFDRYPGLIVDAGHVVLSDVAMDHPPDDLPSATSETSQRNRLYQSRSLETQPPVDTPVLPESSSIDIPDKKRRRTNDDDRPSIQSADSAKSVHLPISLSHEQSIDSQYTTTPMSFDLQDQQTLATMRQQHQDAHQQQHHHHQLQQQLQNFQEAQQHYSFPSKPPYLLQRHSLQAELTNHWSVNQPGFNAHDAAFQGPASYPGYSQSVTYDSPLPYVDAELQTTPSSSYHDQLQSHHQVFGSQQHSFQQHHPHQNLHHMHSDLGTSGSLSSETNKDTFFSLLTRMAEGDLQSGAAGLNFMMPTNGH